MSSVPYNIYFKLQNRKTSLAEEYHRVKLKLMVIASILINVLLLILLLIFKNSFLLGSYTKNNAVLASAAHILKLERYREDYHGPCTRLTCKFESENRQKVVQCLHLEKAGLEH